MPRAKRSRCFGPNTLNNPADDYDLQEVLRACQDVRFARGQLEVGEQGTRHWQWYMEFANPRSLSSVRKMFPGAHIEDSFSPDAASEYCGKEETRVPDTFFEYGTRGKETQGSRNDLLAVQGRLRQGGSVSDIYTEFPLVAAKYPRFIERCADVFTAPRNWKTEVRVFRGPTGCGKTQLAHELYPDIWVKPDGQWFDGYDRHPHVLIDDFDGGRSCGISYRFLLRLLDRYRLQVPIKGGFKEWVPKVIIITTNVEPRGWYPWEDFAPLERRIDECRTWNT